MVLRQCFHGNSHRGRVKGEGVKELRDALCVCGMTAKWCEFTWHKHSCFLYTHTYTLPHNINHKRCKRKRCRACVCVCVLSLVWRKVKWVHLTETMLFSLGFSLSTTRTQTHIYTSTQWLDKLLLYFVVRFVTFDADTNSFAHFVPPRSRACIFMMSVGHSRT